MLPSSTTTRPHAGSTAHDGTTAGPSGAIGTSGTTAGRAPFSCRNVTSGVPARTATSSPSTESPAPAGTTTTCALVK
ncbi:hypothetical protein ACFQV2_26875 [Actinokineospora soli]|uniref:Uncharacterized protein n=1 Tax=Actinokineospora soli TaxID=1048753 RepID=A0ABW2TUS9_9PSEU